MSSLRTVFAQLIDEVETDYFSTAAKNALLNQSIVTLWNKLVYPFLPMNGTDQPAVNAYFESNQRLASYISPFLITAQGYTNNVGYLIQAADFATSNTLDGTPQTITARLTAMGSTEVYMTELSVKAMPAVPPVSPVIAQPENSYYPCQMARKSEIDMWNRMSYYSPTFNTPAYSDSMGVSGGLFVRLYPETRRYYYKIALIAKPATYSDATPCPFPVELTNWIAYKATELAGISIRDNEYVAQVRVELEKLGV